MRLWFLSLTFGVAALWLPGPALAQTTTLDPALSAQFITELARLPRLHSLIVARGGKPEIERVFRGPSLDTPVNVKSASKTIVDALIGIGLDKGLFKTVDQPILPLLQTRAPSGLPPKVGTITLDHLLSMRAGLQRTSGRQYYGRWVMSPNWVSFALSRPFVDEPGGGMLYSTGNTHLLSAILTDASGKTTLELAREWLAKPLGFSVGAWSRDPQGVYFGGNDMAVSPRALLSFGEMFRNGGMHKGNRVVPEGWIRASWTPKTHDRHDDGYGYGWFISEAHGHPVYYAWGFGGQMLYVVPSLNLTAVITSDSQSTAVETDYHCTLQTLIGDRLVPAAMKQANISKPSTLSVHGCNVIPGFPL